MVGVICSPEPHEALVVLSQRKQQQCVLTSSLTAEWSTIRSLETSLVSIQGFSPPTTCVQGSLVNEIRAYEVRTPMGCTSVGYMHVKCTPMKCTPEIGRASCRERE